MKLIGLVGQKNSGKTTVANYLLQKGFKEVVFAEPVKRITEIVFGFPYDILLGDTPEKRKIRDTLKDPVWGKTAVEAMQFIGTEVFREGFDKDVWIKIASRKIQEHDLVVVSDVRFENEVEFIRKMGGEIWVLYEKPEDIVPKTPEQLAMLTGTKAHASENSFQGSILEGDVKIHNQRENENMQDFKRLYKIIDEKLFTVLNDHQSL
jgi:dephospho-CoA kinase